MVKVLRPGRTRAVIAESLILKHQLVIVSQSALPRTAESRMIGERQSTCRPTSLNPSAISIGVSSSAKHPLLTISK
jgi:hypothetical protein